MLVSVDGDFQLIDWNFSGIGDEVIEVILLRITHARRKDTISFTSSNTTVFADQ